MKRIIVLALAALATTSAWAQGTFTIRRPADGATVRETVSVRIPKNSIPDGGYIGVYVNGKFVEAILPGIEGDDYVYKLNSQAKDDDGNSKYPDGPAKIETVLYVDVNGKPQIVNRSSVNVTIDNHASIRVPSDGIRLRYKWNAGAERVYNFSMTQEVGMVSQAQAQLGSRAPLITTEGMNFRLLYATDNAYSVGNERQGLVRIQILPDKGKDYATIIPPGQTVAEKVTLDQLRPIFMRLTDVGREVFGSLPIYFGVEGSSGSTPEMEYFPLMPLPVLPTKAVKQGDVWQATQLFGKVDPLKAHEEDKITLPLPARGELESFVWYKGMPCAVIHNVISVGPEILKNVKNLNNIKGDASNVKLEGRTWFAIDRGVVARMEVTINQESLVETGAPAATGGGGGGMMGPSGNQGSGRKGAAISGGGMAPPPGGGDWFKPGDKLFDFDPQVDEHGNATFFQQRGGRGRGMMGPGGGNPQMGGDEQGARGGQNPGGGNGRFGQRTGGSGGGPRKMVMRVRLSYVAELEQ